jgi:hypothetical protein
MGVRKRSQLLTVFIMFILLTGCNEPNYGDMMRDAFKAALGGDFNGYQFRSFPVDNFGVFTMYDGSYDPANFLCATWSCLGVAPNEVPTDSQALMNVNGNVDPGQGGNISLSTDTQTEIGLNVVVPQILGILNVNASGDWKKHVTVNLNATGGHQRFVVAQKLADYLNGLGDNDVRKRAYRNGTLTVVVSDLIIDSLTATIDLDSSLQATLDAKLSQALQGRTGTVIGKDAAVSFKVNSATTGHYEFQTVSSVIVAMLPKTEPKPQPNLALTEKIVISNFDNWKTSHIDIKKVRGVTTKPMRIQ